MTEDSETQALQKLLDEGWARHDKESARLACDLEGSVEAGIGADFVVPFLHLGIHTIGEHLGDWARALRLGKRVLDGRTPTLETAQGWGRLQVAAVLAGEPIEAADLEARCLKATGSDFGTALLEMRFMLIGALVNTRRTADAARLYGSTIALVETIHSPDALARTIAAVSNNLGWEIYEMTSRSADMDGLMRLCADTGLKFWLRCGNWINEERALYFRAKVSHALGDAAAALADADQALAVIAAQGQRPLDTALLHLVRASALAASGEEKGKQQAIAHADGAASRLAAADLLAQFAAERAKVIATDLEMARAAGRDEECSPRPA